MAQMAANITLHNASRVWCNGPGAQSHYCFPCGGKDYLSIISLKSGALVGHYLSKMLKTAYVGRRVRGVRWGKRCKENGKSKRKEGKIKLLMLIFIGHISTFSYSGHLAGKPSYLGHTAQLTSGGQKAMLIYRIFCVSNSAT